MKRNLPKRSFASMSLGFLLLALSFAANADGVPGYPGSGGTLNWYIKLVPIGGGWVEEYMCQVGGGCRDMFIRYQTAKKD